MRLTIIAAMLALSACGQQATPPKAPPPPAQTQASTTAPANNCAVTVTTQWSTGAAAFTIEATTSGPSCAEATAAIAIRDAQGATIHTASYDAAEITPLSGCDTVSDMQRCLSEWITPAGASMDSTGDLTPWAVGAGEPVNAEVPFHPSEGVNREIYEALRTADAPMYCYQQNALGGLCFAMRDGALKEIGVQTYAG